MKRRDVWCWRAVGAALVVIQTIIVGVWFSATSKTIPPHSASSPGSAESLANRISDFPPSETSRHFPSRQHSQPDALCQPTNPHSHFIDPNSGIRFLATWYDQERNQVGWVGQRHPVVQTAAPTTHRDAAAFASFRIHDVTAVYSALDIDSSYKFQTTGVSARCKHRLVTYPQEVWTIYIVCDGPPTNTVAESIDSANIDATTMGDDDGGKGHAPHRLKAILRATFTLLLETDTTDKSGRTHLSPHSFVISNVTVCGYYSRDAPSHSEYGTGQSGPSPPPSKPHEVSSCTMVHNRSPFIGEWLVYHEMIGVSHFIILDHGSTDNLRVVLEPFIQQGLVTYVQWNVPVVSGKIYNTLQIAAFTFCINLGRSQSQWIMVHDLDEFMVPLLPMSSPTDQPQISSISAAIQQTLREFGAVPQQLAAIRVSDFTFGSSQIEVAAHAMPVKQEREEAASSPSSETSRPVLPQLVTSSHVRRTSTGNFRRGKAIANPSLIDTYAIHSVGLRTEPTATLIANTNTNTDDNLSSTPPPPSPLTTTATALKTRVVEVPSSILRMHHYRCAHRRSNISSCMKHYSDTYDDLLVSLHPQLCLKLEQAHASDHYA